MVFISSTIAIITTGPIIPATRPPARKSFCSSLPVLNAMAFGGVEIGKNKAAEALNPITKGRITLLEDTRIIAIGIKIVVVAVLLIKFERMTVNKENTIIKA